MKRLKEVAGHATASRGTVDHRKGPTVFCYTETSEKSSEEQLFQPNAQKTIKFQTNTGHVEKGGLNDFLPEIFYVVLIFLLFGATAVMSYRVMVEGMD